MTTQELNKASQYTAELRDKAAQLCAANPSIFRLTISGTDEKGRLVFSEPTERMIEKAMGDLEEFQRRQDAIRKRTEVAQGDWLLTLDGSYERITVASSSSKYIQIGGYFGSSVYINSNGRGSYSGGCGRQLETAAIQPTPDYKPACCWLFHEGSSGAGRGVNYVLDFKVWKEVRL